MLRPDEVKILIFRKKKKREKKLYFFTKKEVRLLKSEITTKKKRVYESFISAIMMKSIINNFVFMTIFFCVSSLSIPIDNNSTATLNEGRFSSSKVYLYTKNKNQSNAALISFFNKDKNLSSNSNHSKPYNTNTFELNKFVLSIINAYDENGKCVFRLKPYLMS